jgi:hypothetical protein
MAQNDKLKEQAKADQDLAGAMDFLPAAWWRLFVNLKREGFSESQAMELLMMFIASMGGYNR